MEMPPPKSSRIPQAILFVSGHSSNASSSLPDGQMNNETAHVMAMMVSSSLMKSWLELMSPRAIHNTAVEMRMMSTHYSDLERGPSLSTSTRMCSLVAWIDSI